MNIRHVEKIQHQKQYAQEERRLAKAEYRPRRPVQHAQPEHLEAGFDDLGEHVKRQLDRRKHDNETKNRQDACSGAQNPADGVPHGVHQFERKHDGQRRTRKPHDLAYRPGGQAARQAYQQAGGNQYVQYGGRHGAGLLSEFVVQQRVMGHNLR